MMDDEADDLTFVPSKTPVAPAHDPPAASRSKSRKTASAEAKERTGEALDRWGTILDHHAYSAGVDASQLRRAHDKVAQGASSGYDASSLLKARKPLSDLTDPPEKAAHGLAGALNMRGLPAEPPPTQQPLAPPVKQTVDPLGGRGVNATVERAGIA